MIYENRCSDLQSRAKRKKLTEKDRDSEKERDRSKTLLAALKRQEKERIDFVNIVISRVLCISWKSSIEGRIFLPQTAAYMQTQRQLDFSDIIHKALMEVLCMFSRGEDPLKDITVDMSIGCEDSSNNQASPLLSPVVASSSYQLPTIPLSIGINSPQPSSLTYLLDCYSRIAIEERNHGKQSSEPSLSDVLTILRAQCVQYSSLVLQGLVGICHAAVIPMCTTHLYSILSQNLPPGYLHELVARTHTNPNIFNKIFTPVLQGLYLAMQQASLVGNTHRRPIEALSELIEIRCGPSGNIRPICRLITNQIQFLPDVTTLTAGSEFRKTSFLGPFLSVSVFTIEVAEKFLSKDFVVNRSMKLTLQQELESIRTSLHKMFDAILANSNCHDVTLAYLAALLRHKKREQIQIGKNILFNEEFFPDGFMLNLLSILQMFSVNIKLDTVDLLYPFHPSSFVDIKNDTRLKLTSQEVAEWQKHLTSTHKWMKPKFSTQCWFLTLHCHHIALLPALQKYRSKRVNILQLQEQLDEAQATKSHKPVSDNKVPNDSIYKSYIDILKLRLKEGVKTKSYIDVGLIDTIFLKRCLLFYVSVAEVLLSLLTQTAPGNPLPKLPLSQEVTYKFTALPEWYLEDIADFLLFIFQFCPEVVKSNMDNSLITLLLVIVCTPHCLRNPYLIAKIMKVLHVIYFKVQERTKTFRDIFIAHPISKTFLASYLIKFYTDVETIGTSSEFRDKFTIRYHISMILNSMWDCPIHRASIINENNGMQFVKYINTLMNDITFLLDENLEKFLKNIHNVQELMSNTIAWDALSYRQQHSIETRLAVDTEQVRLSLNLAREIVATFHHLTVDIKALFLRPELVGRLCVMLNLNLQHLCGPKYENLRMRKLEKYGWQPMMLLSQLVDIYLHLDCDNFAAALASDECST